jgi:hypothetical protein
MGKLIGRAALHTLVLDKSQCGDEGLEALIKYVESNPKLTALACDGAAPVSAAVFKKAYEVFVKVERVLSPKADLTALGANGAIPKEISAKQGPKSASARLSEYESFNAVGSGKVQPMNALLGIMSLMVTALKNPDVEPNIFKQQNMVAILKESIVTTNVALRAEQRVKSPLFELMNPESQTAEEFMSEYQTMHIF